VAIILGAAATKPSRVISLPT